jgi:hypothetical protein
MTALVLVAMAKASFLTPFPGNFKQIKPVKPTPCYLCSFNTLPNHLTASASPIAGNETH